MPPVLIHPTPLATDAERAAALLMASASLQTTIEYLVTAGAGDLVSEILRLKLAIVRHSVTREGQS